MKHVELYEDWKALNEIGDAEGKAFTWRPETSYKSYFDSIISKAEKEYTSGSNYMETTPFWFDIKGDKAEYRAQMVCYLRKRIQILMRPGKARPKADPRKWKLTAEFHFNIKGAEMETETNLGEHFKLMAALTQCAIEFINTAEEHVMVEEIAIYAKPDDDSDTSKLDSRRGRLYLAYVKKNLSKLKKKWTAEMTEEGIVLHSGQISTSDDERQANFFYN